MEIRLVSQDEKSKGIACIDFKSETDEEKNFEEKQGAEIGELFTTLERKDKKSRLRGS